MKAISIAQSVALLSTLFSVAPTKADWLGFGTPISELIGAETAPQLVSDGAGGALCAFQLDQFGLPSIYGQRISPSGDPLWNPGGVRISPTDRSATKLTIASDGIGGMFVAWYGPGGEIRAQRMNQDGQAMWTADGVQASPSQGNVSPVVISDGFGGAIVAFGDRAARFDGQGSALWPAGGVDLSASSSGSSILHAAPDGSGGAIVVSGYAPSWMQRVDGSGDLLWGDDGITFGGSFQIRIQSDHAGGIIRIGSVISANGPDLFGARIDGNGGTVWSRLIPTDGTGSLSNFSLVAMQSGDVVVTWQDSRVVTPHVFAQRLTVDGDLLWPGNGVTVATPHGIPGFFATTSDGSEGTLIAWQATKPNGDAGLGAVKLDLTGNELWNPATAQGVWLPADQTQPAILADGSGGALIAWTDNRSPAGQSDVYANRILTDGTSSFDPEIVIQSVDDVPGDQGGRVLLRWAASNLEYSPYQLITHYSIWRSTDDAGGNTAAKLTHTSTGSQLAGSTNRLIRVAGKLTAWEWVGDQEAHYFDEYSFGATTLQDSTSVDSGLHQFLVSARTADQFLFWDSSPFAGYSVDNLAPAAPQGLMASLNGNSLALTWQPNDERDFSRFLVYKDSDPDFNPDSRTRIGYTSDPSFVDATFNHSENAHYKVTAQDRNGNESRYSVITPENITGALFPGFVSSIQRLWPNPFRQAMHVEFTVARRGHVLLRIFDLRGRLVATVVDEIVASGAYIRMWDGLDSNRDVVSAGTYLARLQTLDASQTEKIILIR